MLFSAFYKELNQYYKINASILGDLDLNYPRSMRKVNQK